MTYKFRIIVQGSIEGQIANICAPVEEILNLHQNKNKSIHKELLLLLLLLLFTLFVIIIIIFAQKSAAHFTTAPKRLKVLHYFPTSSFTYKQICLISF